MRVDKKAVEMMQAEFLNLHIDWLGDRRPGNTMARIKKRTAYDPTKFIMVLRQVANDPGFEGLVKTVLFVRGEMKRSERVLAMCRPRRGVTPQVLEKYDRIKEMGPRMDWAAGKAK